MVGWEEEEYVLSGKLLAVLTVLGLVPLGMFVDFVPAAFLYGRQWLLPMLLVVAHDAVNRVILCRVLGLPLSKLWSFRQAPTTLNLLEGPDVEHLEIVRLNDCAHHTPFFGEAVHRAL